MVYEVHVLFVGYSGTCDEGMVANCTCTLIRGRKNIIVDTMTPWDKDRVIAGLARFHLTPDDISLVVCTHGHSDHIGNNNLFLNAKQIVGFSVSYRDVYNLHPFEKGEPFIVDEDVKVIPTPGHTNADVTVLVRTVNLGIVAVVGDLFEREEDLRDPTLWMVTGGSENPKSQEKYRNEMLLLADHIIPGHGPMFAVTLLMRKEADLKLNSIVGGGSRGNTLDRYRHHDDRDWKHPPGENDDRSNLNHGHRPSVWEGRLGPSSDWEARPRDSLGKRPERLSSRRDEPGGRGWTDREKLDRESCDDRRRPPDDRPFSPVPPLLDGETLKRLEHKRPRNLPDPWDGRHPRSDLDQERNWSDRSGPESRPPPERFRGERRPDGPWDDRPLERPLDRLGHEPVRLDTNDRRDDRSGRFSRNEKLNVDERLPTHDDRLRREDRLERDDRPVRDNRPVRNERLPRDRVVGPPPVIKPNRETELQSGRFGGGGGPGGGPGGGKIRRRGARGQGGRRKDLVRGGSLENADAGVRVPRRDEGFRREVREPRRPSDDRNARLKDERRREVRPREDGLHDRSTRAKHGEEGGRNGSNGRTLRFHP